MANRKAATMDLKGNQYSKVKDRLLEFWQDNPHGSIDTKPDVREDGRVMFAVRILKDKSDPHSAEATGHAIGNVGAKDKDFEKLETVAVGRALGLLGYASTGEIASTEEMEEFSEWKQEQFQERVLGWQEQMTGATTLKELGSIWSDMPADVKTALNEQKNELKGRLENTPVTIDLETDTIKVKLPTKYNPSKKTKVTNKVVDEETLI